jgi:hypothetical protein
MHFYILQCIWINMWSSRVFFFNFVIFIISQNLYEENKKKPKVFPILSKWKTLVIIMNLFKLWWLILNFFWYFIFIHYINYLENKSYHMDVVTIACIINSHNHCCENIVNIYIYINITVLTKLWIFFLILKMMHWKDFRNILKRTHWKNTSLKG